MSADIANKVRRNLSIMSVAIVVYVLGDGHIGNKGSLLGGTFYLEHPEIIRHVGILLFFFWLYRYILLNRRPLEWIVQSLPKEIGKSEKFKSHARDLALGRLEAEGARICDELGGDNIQAVRGVTVIPASIDRKIPFRRTASFSCQDASNRAIGKFKMNISWWRCAILELRIKTRLVFAADQFWEQVLPLVLAMSAIMAMGLRSMGVDLPAALGYK